MNLQQYRVVHELSTMCHGNIILPPFCIKAKTIKMYQFSMICVTH